ncbi:MAG: 23S rRNA (adenine(2503)-C(2))-methyltransferase RlmN [Clostridiales bacterium]|jgi:23S rRNA (adenine2503-C2)-methyltransferase|nr:23S rRNA (adenine(2503)-C(2))-methyltransferase RlmN [Clostridiales bacterium]
MKKSLLELNESEMTELMRSVGEPTFRARQLFENLYSGKSFDDMTNIPSALRDKLKINYTDIPAKIEKKFFSKDGTVKYLFSLDDGELVEGVLMTYKYGKTLCISTQIGCRMGCVFCASGIGGLKRNLTSAEMLAEIITVNADNACGKDRAVTNVVLMGSGEPLDNFDNTERFLRLISAPYTLNISERNISLSTSGIVDGIRALADTGHKFNLTISLHAPCDEIRNKIMPINKKYDIAGVISAAKYYFEKTKRRLIFEYSLIEGINDGAENARLLCKLLKGLPCHVNLIKLNSVKGKNLRASGNDDIKEFLSILNTGGISSTLRRIMGVDIEGACGQLRRRFAGCNDTTHSDKEGEQPQHTGV